jgi:hypothetical protein
MEILVTVAIVGLLITVMVPLVTNRLALAHVDAIVGEMKSLQQALITFNRDVGRYPARLDYLNVLPTSGVVDVCGAAISAQNQAKFRGPYINKPIDMVDPFNPVPANVNTRYVLATDDSVESVVNRTTITNPVTGGTQQVLQIEVIGPDQTITRMIDSTVDGVVDKDNGIVRYASLLATGNTILWTIPIKNGDC